MRASVLCKHFLKWEFFRPMWKQRTKERERFPIIILITLTHQNLPWYDHYHHHHLSRFASIISTPTKICPDIIIIIIIKVCKHHLDTHHNLTWSRWSSWLSSHEPVSIWSLILRRAGGRSFDGWRHSWLGCIHRPGRILICTQSCKMSQMLRMLDICTSTSTSL